MSLNAEDLSVENIQAMSNCFTRVVNCIRSSKYKNIEPDDASCNCYVPDFLIAMRLPDGYNPKDIYHLYPKYGSRMDQFCKFIDKIDENIKVELFKHISNI